MISWRLNCRGVECVSYRPSRDRQSGQGAKREAGAAGLRPPANSSPALQPRGHLMVTLPGGWCPSPIRSYLLLQPDVLSLG